MSGYNWFAGNTLQHTATHPNTLQHTATHCNTLQHTATHFNTLQHTATHCNTLQHTASHSKMSGYDRFAGAEGLRGLCHVKSVVADRCVAARGSVLQRAAVCCVVLQCAAMTRLRRGEPARLFHVESVVPDRCVAVCYSVLQYAVVCCSVLQCAVVCCSVSQYAAACCSVLHCAACAAMTRLRRGGPAQCVSR